MYNEPESDITDSLLLSLRDFLSKQKKMLIVEDDPERIKWMQKHLTPNHYATIATNGEAALRVLQRDQDWDIIFLDHDLTPEHIAAARLLGSPDDYFEWQKEYDGPLTGFDLACWLAAQNWTDDIPILIHSMNREGSAAIKTVLSGSKQIPFDTFKSCF